MFTDTHCHLFNEYYDDIEGVLNEAKDAGVTKMIVAAANVKTCDEVQSLSQSFDSVYYCLGIHPEDVGDSFEELKKKVIDSLDDSKFVAIGEIGLDYYYTKDNKDEQIKLFEQQLALAQEYNLPVVIHSREATLDTLTSLKKFKVRGVVHCFSGSLETAMEYVKMGFYIGVGGVMTFKNSKIDEIIKDIPLNRIVLETDAPYLTPEPYRKYHNSPKYIPVIAEYLANIMHIPVSKVSEVTQKNVKDIFDI